MLLFDNVTEIWHRVSDGKVVCQAVLFPEAPYLLVAGGDGSLNEQRFASVACQRQCPYLTSIQATITDCHHNNETGVTWNCEPLDTAKTNQNTSCAHGNLIMFEGE